MNLQYNMPPDITGESMTDVSELSVWCGGLITHLKKILTNIEDSNISYVSASKIKGGNIDIGNIGIDGTSLKISENSLTFISDGAEILKVSAGPEGYSLVISNADKTQYIKLENGLLNISCSSIAASSITAKNITSDGEISGNIIRCNYIYAGNLSDGGGGVIA